MFTYFSPTANSSVRLDGFQLWGLDNSLNPFVLDYRTVWPDSNGLEVFRKLHFAVTFSAS